MTSESSDTDSSWEGDGCEHPKYYRKEVTTPCLSVMYTTKDIE